MKRLLLKSQFQFFLICLLVPGAVFAWQAWSLLPLYTNGDLRERVRTGLTGVADKHGWILSDMDVNEVMNDRVQFTYHEHKRGPDTETCYVLTLPDSALHPCE